MVVKRFIINDAILLHHEQVEGYLGTDAARTRSYDRASDPYRLPHRAEAVSRG